MARVETWKATLPDGSLVEAGPGRSVEDLVGPFSLLVTIEGGRRVALEALPGERAHVFTRVMKTSAGDELTVPVIVLQGVKHYLHPDGDVISTEDLYW